MRNKYLQPFNNRWCLLALSDFGRMLSVGVSRLIWTPLKLVPLGTNFFWNIRTHSEKFVPTIGQPHKWKSVTTKDIGGVHSCISRKINHECASAGGEVEGVWTTVCIASTWRKFFFSIIIFCNMVDCAFVKKFTKQKKYLLYSMLLLHINFLFFVSFILRHSNVCLTW